MMSCKNDRIGEHEIFEFANSSVVAVHDIFNKIPEFMKTADCIFTDLPYNLCQLNGYYTKAEIKEYKDDFKKFYIRLFECIDEIKPNVLFLEIGKEYLAELISACKARYKYVTFYNSTYYHSCKNKCYIIQSTNDFKKRRYKSLEDMDEEDAIKWICKNVDYNCIGDLCMGKGLVGINAYKNGKRFVGTELNKKRLAVLVDGIGKIESDEKRGLK